MIWASWGILIATACILILVLLACLIPPLRNRKVASFRLENRSFYVYWDSWSQWNIITNFANQMGIAEVFSCLHSFAGCWCTKMAWQWNTGCNRKLVRAMKESWITVDSFNTLFSCYNRKALLHIKASTRGMKLYRMRKQNKNFMKQNPALLLMDDFSGNVSTTKASTSLLGSSMARCSTLCSHLLSFEQIFSALGFNHGSLLLCLLVN